MSLRVAVFSSKPYDRQSLISLSGAAQRHAFTFLEPRLDTTTAPLAVGHQAVCLFVNDVASAPVLEMLASSGIGMLALRCAGYNNVDLEAARRLRITIGRVPGYSPNAVAEHTVGLMLALNRKIHRAYTRVREHNFALDGLLGFDMHGRTAGVVGTGRIGLEVCKILRGFGCHVLAVDQFQNPEALQVGVQYTSTEDLFCESDIVTLHCPLTEQTHHLVDEEAINAMRPGVMLINTSRGGLLDTRAVLNALKSGRIGYLGLDVYEEEGPLFFEDRSANLMQDDVFARLLTFPNVLVTGHQAFFTREALSRIAEVTLENLSAFEQNGQVPEQNRVI